MCVYSLSFIAFVSNLNAESIIDMWNFPAKTKIESNKRREGMYNIIDLQLMGGLSEHKNGGRVAQGVRSLDLTTHTSLSPIRRGFSPGFVNYEFIYKQHVYTYYQVKQGQ